MVDQRLDVLLVAGGDREHVGVQAEFVRLVEHLDQLRVRESIDLVDDDHDLRVRRLERSGDPAIAGPDALLGVEEEEHRVAVAQF